jgi:hypothetical protein
MAEENKIGDNGKQNPQEPQFDCFIKIFFNTKTKDFASETHVPDVIIGYGLCELGKKCVDTHIAKIQQQRVIPAKGGILNFVRRRR